MIISPWRITNSSMASLLAGLQTDLSAIDIYPNDAVTIKAPWLGLQSLVGGDSVHHLNVRLAFR
jgi:hypothetical protein